MFGAMSAAGLRDPGPVELAPGGKGTAKGRGRLGHGPGRLWPWPRRPGVRGEGGGSDRGGHADAGNCARCVTKTTGTSQVHNGRRRDRPVAVAIDELTAL